MTATPSLAEPSAHACTADVCPAIAYNDTWLLSANAARQSAEVLHKQYRRLKRGDYAQAVWDGYWELSETAKRAETFAIKWGALLHISVPGAVQQAIAHLKQRGVMA